MLGFPHADKTDTHCFSF